MYVYVRAMLVVAEQREAEGRERGVAHDGGDDGGGTTSKALACSQTRDLTGP